MVLPAILFGSLGGIAAYRYGRILQRQESLPKTLIPLFQDVDKATKKPVIILGGGVVGITTAYKLAQQGHKVAVIEPRDRAGDECSSCAAGGMQRANPVVDKDSWVAVLKCIFPRASKLLLGGEEEPFKFFAQTWRKTVTDPFFLRWALTFSTTSLMPDEHQDTRQLEMLKFTKYAVDDMVTMMEDKSDCMAKVTGYNPNGSISVSYDEASDSPEKPEPHDKRSMEPKRMLSKEEALAVEPSLKHQLRQPTGAKFEFESKSASSERFTKELASRCESDPQLDVTILYGTAVEAFEEADGRVAALHTSRGTVVVPEGAQVVVAAGSWTPKLLARCGLYVPVYPLRGYAISLDARDARPAAAQDLPSRIVSDKYMFTTRLGEEVRITSIGEFAGWSTEPTARVDAEFRRQAKEHMPQLAQQIDDASTSVGLRPYVNDGILLIGAVESFANLFVSCGPGSNGWKLATGSGELMARLIQGQSSQEIQAELGFDAAAMAPKGRVLRSPLFALLCRLRWGE